MPECRTGIICIKYYFNMVYGKKASNTPDGAKAAKLFAARADPMHGRDAMRTIPSLGSFAKLSYQYYYDGISHTFSIVPSALGKTEDIQINNLVLYHSNFAM